MLRTSLSLLALVVCLATTAIAQTTASKPSAKPSGAVNLNAATVAELEALPGIGPKVAARIVEYRAKNGPFHKVEDLMNVQGIGEKSFLKLKPQLTLTLPKADRAAAQEP